MSASTIIFAGGTAVAGLIALSAVFGSFYTVDEGDRGVTLRNGAVTGVADPGLHFKLPFFDDVVHISTRSQAQTYTDIATYSKDQQSALLDFSVTYALPADQVVDIYRRYGGEDGVKTRLLDRHVMERVKEVFGQFNAVTAIQDRERLGADIEASIREAVVGPIVIESITLEDIEFSAAYEDSIEQRMLAEVEVQRVRQNAEREQVTAEITVIQAQAAADSSVAAATAEAEATRLRAEAEAESIRLMGEASAAAIEARSRALASNPSLIELTKAERWNGELPSTMVPGSAIPFIDVGPGRAVE